MNKKRKKFFFKNKKITTLRYNNGTHLKIITNTRQDQQKILYIVYREYKQSQVFILISQLYNTNTKKGTKISGFHI